MPSIQAYISLGADERASGAPRARPHVVGPTKWLEVQEFGAVLTKHERERFDNAAKTVRETIGKGAATLIEAFVKGLAEGWSKAMTA